MKLVFNISSDGFISCDATNNNITKHLDNKRAESLFTSLDEDFYNTPKGNIKINGKDVAFSLEEVFIRIKNYNNLKKNNLEYLLPLSSIKIDEMFLDKTTRKENNIQKVSKTRKAKKYVYIAGLMGMLAVSKASYSSLKAEEPIGELTTLTWENIPEEEMSVTPIYNNIETIEQENNNSYIIPPDVYQSGISINNTYYDITWDVGTNQRELYNDWKINKTSDKGIATLDNRYLVAVSQEFGEVGDYIDIILEDDSVIPAIIADSKDPKDMEHELGHYLDLPSGNKGVDIVEWEIITSPENLSIDEWRTKWVKEIINYTRELKRSVTK